METLEYSYKPNARNMIVIMTVSLGMSAYMASQATAGRGLIIQRVIHLSPKAAAIFHLVLAGLFALVVPFSIFNIVVSQIRKDFIRLTETEITFNRINRSSPDTVVRLADINKVNSEVRPTLLKNQRFIHIHHSGGKLLIIDQSHLPSPSAYEFLYESIINRLQLMQLSQSLKFTDIPKDAIIYAKLPKVKAADTLTRNINGIGTTLYGKREFQKDGSYISTVWLIFLLFPLIPLRSFRIRKSGTDSMYEIIEKVPMNWRQVLYIYGYVAFFFVWTSISIHKEAIFWLGTGALVCAPFFVRRWARSNAK